MLESLDTIAKNGSTDTNSVLYSIVNSVRMIVTRLD